MTTRNLAHAGSAGLALLGLSLVLFGASPAVARPGAAEPTIRSSLDGKLVLPHRLRWIAYPSFPVNFPGVEFLIDGKVVFANRLPPFAFGADAKDEASGTVKTGYLVTSWLKPGPHEFTVRAKGQGAYRNASASKTVVARVGPAQAPHAQLAGTWQRDLATAVPPDRNSLYRGVTARPGIYRIAIDPRYLRVSGPDPSGHVKSDYIADARTLRVGGPVWTGDPHEGAWCDPWGPEATYAWSVSGGVLTLEAPASGDGCKQRGGVLAGEWTRVG
jgi:hypothetical protein